MRLRYKIAVLLILFNFIIGSLILQTMPNVKADSTDYFYFVPSETELSDSDFNNTFNLGNPRDYTQTYNATFSFTDDTIGQNPSGFTCSEPASTDFEVIADKTGHDKVLLYDDDSGANAGSISQDFNDDVVRGTFEFWFMTNTIDTNTAFQMSIRDDDLARSTAVLRCKDVAGDRFEVRDGGGWTNLMTAATNTWYHFSIGFDCTDDVFNVTVNADYKNEYDFDTTQVEIDQWLVGMGSTWTGDQWFDGLGYTWEYYDIYDNLFPLSALNESVITPLRDDFNFEGIDSLYNTSDTNPNEWDNIDIGTGSGATGAIDSNEEHGRVSWDNVYWFNVFGADTSKITGMEKEYSSSGDFINFTARMSMDVIASGGYLNFTIRSSDDTDVIYLTLTPNAGIGVDMECDFDYYSGGSPVHLVDDIEMLSYREINIRVHYGLDIAVLTVAGVSYYFPLMSTGKEGLGKIVIQAQLSAAGTCQPFFDYIYVDVEGAIIANDLGFNEAYMNRTNSFSRQRNYLYNHTQNGRYIISACGTNGTEYIPSYSNHLIIANETQYTNQSIFENIVELEVSTETPIVNSTIVLFFNDTCEYFSITQLDFKGCYISRNWENEYIFEWDRYYDTMDINETYVWADSNYSLRFQYTSRDPDNELLYLTFEFSPTAATDKALLFRGYANCSFANMISLGYTAGGGGAVEYPAGINLDLDSIERDYAYSLHDGRFYYGVLIRFFDGDAIGISTSQMDKIRASYVPHLNMTSTGFVSYLRIIYLPDLALTYTPIALMYAMIPIIILIVPTFKLRQRYGNGIILPMFFFMSIICVATGLIPIWLFFIIALGFSVFIFKRRKKNDGN